MYIMVKQRDFNSSWQCIDEVKASFYPHCCWNVHWSVYLLYIQAGAHFREFSTRNKSSCYWLINGETIPYWICPDWARAFWWMSVSQIKNLQYICNWQECKYYIHTSHLMFDVILVFICPPLYTTVLSSNACKRGISVKIEENCFM